MSEFDFSQILLLLNNDYQQLLTVLKMFREDYANVQNEITAHITAGNFNQAEKLLHQFKGVAGNVGAIALYKHSDRLDQQLKQQHYDPETLQQWQRLCAETLQAIAELENQNLPVDVVFQQANPKKFQQLTEQLDGLLAQHDFISNHLLDELFTTLSPEHDDIYKHLVAAIKKLDYPTAKAMLAQLIELTKGRI